MSVAEDFDIHAKTSLVLARLRVAAANYSPAVLASSLSPEDMLLTDLIARSDVAIGVFTLDTGRLNEETYELMAQVHQRYDISFDVYAPDAADVEAYVRDNGPNGFYDSVMLRRECCYIRKVRPLKRALSGKRAWLTGQRREQSATRQELPFDEWDEDNRLHKFNPLADWSQDEVWAYIRRHDVPTNALHAKGYPSIGCAPCTRAIEPGEDERAGRWWWEQPENKECGLHVRSHAS